MPGSCCVSTAAPARGTMEWGRGALPEGATMPDQSTPRRSLLAGGVVGSALGGLVLAPGDADAAITVPTAPSVAFFLALAGLPGDSTDAEFPGTFDILDWSLGTTTSIGPSNHTA